MASNGIGKASIEIEADADGFDESVAKEARQAGAKGGKEFSESFEKNTAAVALGSAIGNLLAQGLQSAMGAVKGLISDALVQSDAIDKFKATLNFAGLGTADIERLTASTKRYADETVYSLGDIQNITAQLAANSVKDYDQLAEAAGNLNAIAGGNADTFQSVGMVLTQTAGQGKLVTENWNQLANAIPGASGILQKALLDAGAYTGNFRDAMAQGQITAEEFNAALLTVGNQPIAAEAARSTETFEGAIGNLQAALLTLTTNLVDKVKPQVTGIISALGDGVSTVANFVAGINSFSDVTAIFENLSGMRDQIIQGLITGLPAIVEAIAAFLPGAISTIVSSAVQMWTGIITALAEVLPAVVSALAAAIPQILTALVGAIPVILAGALSMFQAIVTALTTIIPQLITTLVALIPQLVQTIITALPLLIAGAIQLFMGIIQGLVTAIPLIVSAVLALLPVLADAVISMLPGLVSAAIELFLALVEGVLTILPDVIVAVLTLLPQLITTLLSMLPSLIESAITLFLGIVTGIAGALPKILTALLEILPSLISTIIQMIPQLITAAITLFLGIVQGIVRATPEIIGALIRLIPQLVQALVSAAPQLLQAGKQAIQGFIDGIASMAKTVFNAAVNVVKGAIDGVKNFLGINSPSRLLRGLGHDTMDGYIEGVDDLAGAAQKALVAAMTPPTPAPVDVASTGLGRPGQSSAVVSQERALAGSSASDGSAPAGSDIDINVIGELHPERTARAVADALAEKVAVVAA